MLDLKSAPFTQIFQSPTPFGVVRVSRKFGYEQCELTNNSETKRFGAKIRRPRSFLRNEIYFSPVNRFSDLSKTPITPPHLNHVSFRMLPILRFFHYRDSN